MTNWPNADPLPNPYVPGVHANTHHHPPAAIASPASTACKDFGHAGGFSPVVYPRPEPVNAHVFPNSAEAEAAAADTVVEPMPEFPKVEALSDEVEVSVLPRPEPGNPEDMAYIGITPPDGLQTRQARGRAADQEAA